MKGKRRLRGAFWTNKRYGKSAFQGTYERVKSGRVFELFDPAGKRTRKTYESPEAAKAHGWVKVKK